MSVKFINPKETPFLHPFKMSFFRSTDEITISLPYHSSLFKAPTSGYKNFERIPIVGLNSKEKISVNSIKNRPYYAILKLTINNLQVSKAEIDWEQGYEGDSNLDMFKFDSETNLKQQEARVVLGAVIFDNKSHPQVYGGDADSVNMIYVQQFVFSHLIVTNMVINGVPVVYPVPFVGAPIPKQ